jgi:uncharacterized damage-inducible protein DinB
MQLREAGVSILNGMEHVVGQISDDDFVKPSPLLGGVTIGQHLRHTIEFFQCLESGVKSGTINYDKRNHDNVIETDRLLALVTLERIKNFVTHCQSDKSLSLEVGYDRHSEKTITVATNFHRELIYNIEHTVHHMALMKIGIRQVAPYVVVPQDFGVAASTLRYDDMIRMSWT